MNRVSELCAAFGIDAEEFRQTLASGSMSPNVEDLVLAHGCARGNAAAWECFVAQYGGRLQSIALSITREQSSARELAGSLYSDLFGSAKLLSYSGRGSLEGWLRAVMAQEHVNRIRKSERLMSYVSDFDSRVQRTSPGPEDQPDARLAAAVDGALKRLKPEEQFLLASYYLDGRTLAQIGQLLGVHESTISRKMAKLMTRLRKRTLGELRSRGLSAGAAEEMLDCDVRDVQVDVGARLMGIRK